MSSLSLDAEALYAELRRRIRPLLETDTRLVGVVSGGCWLAERLRADLHLPGEVGGPLHRPRRPRPRPAPPRQPRRSCPSWH